MGRTVDATAVQEEPSVNCEMTLLESARLALEWTQECVLDNIDESDVFVRNRLRNMFLQSDGAIFLFVGALKR